MADLVVRQKFERPTQANPGWWKGALGFSLYEAQFQVPPAGATRNSFRSPDRVFDVSRANSRARDQFYIRQTQPTFSWLYGHAPIFFEAPFYQSVGDATRNSFRAGDRFYDSQRVAGRPRGSSFIWQTDPNDGWQKGIFGFGLYEAPFYVSVGDATRNSYRPPTRPLPGQSGFLSLLESQPNFVNSATLSGVVLAAQYRSFFSGISSRVFGRVN